MATYVKNKYMIGIMWREDNPDWERYYTAENAPGFGEVGEWKDKLHQIKTWLE